MRVCASVDLDWLEMGLLIRALQQEAKGKRHCTPKHDAYCVRIGRLKKAQRDHGLMRID